MTRAGCSGGQHAPDAAMPTYQLTGEVWRYAGKGGWHFVTLPVELADELAARHTGCAPTVRVAARARFAGINDLDHVAVQRHPDRVVSPARQGADPADRAG